MAGTRENFCLRSWESLFRIHISAKLFLKAPALVPSSVTVHPGANECVSVCAPLRLHFRWL